MWTISLHCKQFGVYSGLWHDLIWSITSNIEYVLCILRLWTWGCQCSFDSLHWLMDWPMRRHWVLFQGTKNELTLWGCKILRKCWGSASICHRSLQSITKMHCFSMKYGRLKWCEEKFISADYCKSLDSTTHKGIGYIQRWVFSSWMELRWVTCCGTRWAIMIEQENVSRDHVTHSICLCSYGVTNNLLNDHCLNRIWKFHNWL